MPKTRRKSTAPKPFIFVLMPFDKAFKNVYEFGIKGAADAIGAYAERLDEQLYKEGMLDRIFNQISRADVIVADMSSRNPNVFYEVGYAHALDKIVILLTQEAEDIPFDLKHRQHILYSKDDIESMKSQLTTKLVWAISESKKQGKESAGEQYEVNIEGMDIPEGGLIDDAPVIRTTVSMQIYLQFYIRIYIRNVSPEPSPAITHVYLFADPNNEIVPGTIQETQSFLTMFAPLVPYDAKKIDAYDGLKEQFRLRATIPSLPSGALEDFLLSLKGFSEVPQKFRLRLHSNRIFDYPFSLEVFAKDKE